MIPQVSNLSTDLCGTEFGWFRRSRTMLPYWTVRFVGGFSGRNSGWPLADRGVPPRSPDQLPSWRKCICSWGTTMSGNLDKAKLKAMAISMRKRGYTGQSCSTRHHAKPGIHGGSLHDLQVCCRSHANRNRRDRWTRQGGKLGGGADVFIVDPLPRPSQSELRGYSQCPAGVPTDTPGYIPHPGYPPGLGAPQWELVGYPQTGLKWIASVTPGQRFSYQASLLPARP